MATDEPRIVDTINREFRAHPLRFPLTLIPVGLGLLGLWFIVVGNAPWLNFGFVIFVLGAGGLSLVMGLVMLPIGIMVAVRRERSKLVLQCPSCGLRATETRQPFRVERLNYVEYSMVTCPRCKWEFTVDKYAKLA